MYDIVIIGGGPAGMTAAIYAVRAGLSAVTIERGAPGGQMVKTSHIDNYPGFANGIEGYELAMAMQKQASGLGAEMRYTGVERADITGRVKRLRLTNGEEIAGRTVIIATGAHPRMLGLDNEKEVEGRGVSYCATCDGAFFRGKNVCVAGGGDSAAADAMFLSRLCAGVSVIHRRDRLRAARKYADIVLNTPNIEVIWNTKITGMIGQTGLTGLLLEDAGGGSRREMACDGLFIAIGSEPATGLFADAVALDELGYIIAGEDTVTSCPGVFAAGDARAKPVRQIVGATADAAAAVQACEEYIAG